MNSIERVRNRLIGDPVDRIPNLNIIMQFAARYININYGKYCTDFNYLVEGNIKCCYDFGIDMVSAISDPFREAAGFGSGIIINDDDVPSCRDFLVKEYEDIHKLKVINPLKAERMADRIKAIELYAKTVKSEFPILGWVEGPFAEANNLRGMTELMIDIYDQPSFVNELMEICLEQEIAFAKEQIKAGADFIGIGDAAASLVGPDIYERIILPFEKRLIKAIHQMNAKVKLHICGDTGPILKYMATSEAEIIDIDWMVDFGTAVKIIGRNACVCGNFDPVKVLLQGIEDEIKKSVLYCIRAGDNRTFISAGCEVPKFTPIKNLKAVTQALIDYSKNKPLSNSTPR